MEKDRIEAALETSRLWFKAAEDTRKGGSYNVSLYSLEMSMEIMLKAILMTQGIDPPKTHDIGNVVKRALGDLKNKNIDKKELAEIIDLFYVLLGLRNESGYMYDSRMSNSSLKELVNKYFEATRKSLQSCTRILNLLTSRLNR